MPRGNLIEEQLIHSIIGGFFEVYNALGFGFMERAYVLSLERELRANGHDVACEVFMQIMYKGEPLMDQRLDMIVDRRIVVEIKSTEQLHGGATRQVYNYLRATGLEAGLLLHFGVKPRFWRVFRRESKKYEKHSPHSEHE